MLVTVATVILVAFTLLERSVRARLETFGLNTLVIRELMTAADQEMIPNGAGPDRLAPLQRLGHRVQLRQLYIRGQTEWGTDLMAYSYSPDSVPELAPWLSPKTPLICFSDRLPEDTLIEVTLNRQTGAAVVRRMDSFLRPLGGENLLFVPQGWTPDSERLGYVETTLFQRASDGPSMQQFVDAVNLLGQLERRRPAQLQSPVAMIRELERLQARQNQWRKIMAILLGLALALVYGAIAVLEFRQNLYIGALLRSFGTPALFLYFRQWAENAFVANTAAILAILTVYSLHSSLFGTLGFPRSVLDLKLANPYLTSEIGLILACVNIGAFLSSLPVALGLRREVGEILS